MNLSDRNGHIKAMALAIQREQEYYTLVMKGSAYSIMLPKPQTAGTWTQQLTYAKDKAQEILDQFAK